MSLQNPPTSTLTILAREDHAALFAVINKSRLLNGWQTRTAQELDPTIRIWHEAFSFYQIPSSAYPQLYQRALDVRQQKMQSGGDVPQMDATLLISQWTGNYGLQVQLRQREVEKGRMLPANAESVCQDCFGTNLKTVIQNGYRGKVKCEHSEEPAISF